MIRQARQTALIGLTLILLTSLHFTSGAAAPPLNIADSTPQVAFPQTITFHAHITGTGSPIQNVILLYGVEKRTCGTVLAKAFPVFKPAAAVDASWTWDMRKSGGEPAGAKVWYQWQVTDSSGNVTTSDKKLVTWLDSAHAWKSVSHDKITLHWYDEPADFASTLLDSTSASLKQLSATTGVAAQFPVDVYIYNGSEDLRKATLYEPNWIGGVAFSPYNIVLIGINQRNFSWGKGALTHEITHILVGHLTFGCLVSIPTWLNEGIAVYAQGGPDSSSQALFDIALRDNQLLSIRALSGSFSEEAQKAGLSYSESYSVVNYLVATYGKDKLLKLFGALHDGNTVEQALLITYGFGLGALEAGWRVSLGAPVQPTPVGTPTAQPSPTLIPTFAPVGSTPSGSTN